MGKLDNKKLKVSLVIDEFFIKNLIFDLSSSFNRDNCFYPYALLRNLFFQEKYNLSTSDINTIEESEIIIYNDMPKVLPKKENISKSYLLLFESELIRPDNWNLDNHKYFNKIFTWDDRLIDNKKYFKINFSHLFPDRINMDVSNKKKLCTLIAGNKMVRHPLELYSKRVEAIRWFEQYHLDEFDFYGVGWDEYRSSNRYLNIILRKLNLSKIFKKDFPSYKGLVNSKKDTLEQYRFSICYENAKDIDGYITEKIFDCFFAGCVPIYWGANNITTHIPKECFIDKRDFETYELLYDFIVNMPNEIYLAYLENIELYLNSEVSDKYTADYFAETIVKTILDDIE